MPNGYNSEFTGQHNDEYDDRINNLLSQINTLQTQLNGFQTQLTSLSNSLNNYLPLTGGTLTGPLTVSQVLTVTPQNSNNEGGEIVLQKTGTSGTTDAHLDWFNGYFRVHNGTREIFTMNDICKPGDTLTISALVVPGMLTSSNKDLYLLFPINKIMRANGVRCTQLMANIRCNNSYLGASAYVAAGTNFSSYVTTCAITQVGIHVALNKNASWGGTNNSACAAQIVSATFVFS